MSTTNVAGSAPRTRDQVSEWLWRRFYRWESHTTIVFSRATRAGRPYRGHVIRRGATKAPRSSKETGRLKVCGLGVYQLAVLHRPYGHA